MLDQAKLQKKLCSGMSQSRPDLNEIFKSAQRIYWAREKAQKEIGDYLQLFLNTTWNHINFVRIIASASIFLWRNMPNMKSSTNDFIINTTKCCQAGRN